MYYFTNRFIFEYLVVKKQTPFDDQNSPRIRNLTVQLKERLGSHKVVLEDLQNQILQQQRKNQESKYSETVVKSLKSKLSYSFQQFQNVLKNRTKQMKSMEERQKKFGISQSTGPMIAPNIPPPMNHFTPQNLNTIQPNLSNGYLPTQSSNKPINNFNRQQNGIQIQDTINIIQSNENYIVQRNQDIKDIETDIVQLGGMFNQLAIMITEQGELTQTIERNVMDASNFVDQAQSELLKLLQRITSNRGLIIKIFIVMIIFIGLTGAFILS